MSLLARKTPRQIKQYALHVHYVIVEKDSSCMDDI